MVPEKIGQNKKTRKEQCLFVFLFLYLQGTAYCGFSGQQTYDAILSALRSKAIEPAKLSSSVALVFKDPVAQRANQS